MTRVKKVVVTFAAVLLLGGTHAAAQDQTKLPALVDPNTGSDKELAAVSNITPAIAKVIVSRRPFKTVVDLDNVLKEQKLTAEQITGAHRTLFVRLNLNSATDDEILAIPGIGKRMLHEFKEYRPYTSMEQFRREIGKYIDKDKREAELARLERYVFIK